MRLTGSRAQLGVARASLFPTLNANASYVRQQASNNGLFAVADERLYAAKAAGRNAVIGERLPETEDAPRLALVR